MQTMMNNALSFPLSLIPLMVVVTGVLIPGNVTWLNSPKSTFQSMTPNYEEYLPINYIILGEDGLPIIRTIVNKDSDCPALVFTNETKKTFPLPHLKMRSVGDNNLPHAFPIKLCELMVNFRKLRSALRMGSLGISSSNEKSDKYPLPKVKHDQSTFLLIGDTGLRSEPKGLGLGELCNNESSMLVYDVHQCDVNLTRDDLVVGDIEGSFQDASPSKWPFKHLAEEASKLNIDTIVHVGDYLYRQGPCPYTFNCSSINLPLHFDNSDLIENDVVMNFLPGMWGDNWFGWWGDFFWPALNLLKQAPMIAVRGNHEICSRAGYGYRLFLSHQGYPSDVPAGSVCEEYTSPYAVKFEREQFLVSDVSAVKTSHEVDDFDFVDGACPSSPTNGTDYLVPEQLALPSDIFLPQREVYAKNFEDIEAMSLNFDTNFYVGHYPLLAVACNGTNIVTLDYTLQQSLRNGTLDNIVGIISGHIHWLEVLEFRNNSLPAQIVVGNGGTELIPNYMDQKILPKLKLELGRNEFGMAGFVDRGVISSKFGFGIMTRLESNEGYNVTFKEWDPVKLEVDDMNFHVFIPNAHHNRSGIIHR